MNMQNQFIEGEVNESPKVLNTDRSSIKPIDKRSKTSVFSSVLGKVIDVCIFALAGLTPVWFLPFTVDILELNKQTLVLVLTLVATLAWVAKALIEKHISFSKSWLHAVVLFFLSGYLVTALFSQDRYLSLVGNIGQMQWAFTTLAIFTLLYFVVANRFTDKKCIYCTLFFFIAGSIIAGMFGLLQIFGIYLFGSGNSMAVQSFNTVGTINALGVFLSVPMLISLALFVLRGFKPASGIGFNKVMEAVWNVAVYVMLVIGLIIAIILDFWAVWVLILSGIVLLGGLQFIRERHCPEKPMMITMASLAAISIIFLFFQMPFQPSLPAEVAPSLKHTWSIAQQTLRDRPIFGSGPGTWIYDYAKYRSSGANVSQFWTIRFERGLTTFFTLIPMVGLVGIALWLILVISVIFKSLRSLFTATDKEQWTISLIIFVGWFATVLTAFLYNFNLTHHFAFWLFLGLLGVLVGKNSNRVESRSSWISGVLSAIMIILGLSSLCLVWLSGQRFAAEVQYSKSVKNFQRQGSIDDSIALLQSAISLNRMNDVYYRNLSQAFLVKVAQLTQTEATEEKMNTVNSLIGSAVEVSKKAVEVAPKNVDNYSNLAVVYQSIASFTKGADEFAISSYVKALELEPSNPVFMNEIGKLYVLRSDAYRTLLGAEDQEVAKNAQTSVDAELNMAADWFNRAISAKPDYAAAHFNLGLVYERQNKVADAVRKFEEVLATDPNDLSVAFQLAILYYRNGDKDASQNLFEQIVTAQPDFANARWFLAAIYEEKGLYDQAIEQVGKVKETNPENAEVDARLAELNAKKSGNVAPTNVGLPQPVEEMIKTP